MKKKILFLAIFLLTFALHAQSADVITQILEAEQVTLGQVCYLSAVQQGLVGEKATYQQALQILEEKEQIPKYQFVDMPVPYANLCYIFSKMWNVKGGIMYRVFKSAPRYAFKQFKYDGVIPSNADPNHFLSGQEALNVFTSCSLKYGKMELTIE